MLRKLTAPPQKLLGAANENEDAVVNLSGAEGQAQLVAPANGINQLEAAKQLAKDNPRMVASVVANWTSGNE